MNMTIDKLVNEARAAGILPAEADHEMQAARPWPVVLLTALGAWLAAVPLFGVAFLFFDDLFKTESGLYFAGILSLGVSVLTLRSRIVPLFVEQLAVPALIVGIVSVGFALLSGDMPERPVLAILAVLCGGLAWLVPQAWLRVPLGFGAAVFVTVSLVHGRLFEWGGRQSMYWLFALYISLGVWVGAFAALRLGKPGRYSAAVEAASTGWIIAIVLACAFWAGMNLLDVNSFDDGLDLQLGLLQAGSLTLALMGAAWLAYSWPAARSRWLTGVALVLMALSWLMPSLGAVLLVMALCATSGRWLLLGAGALATAWIVGAFYYQLSYPLATKAAMLVAAGALLGLMAWVGRPPGQAAQAKAGSTAPVRWDKFRLAIVAASLAVLAVANIGIWRNEQVIATGQAVFVELAPADPRSLMQGDYMRLNFGLPETNQVVLEDVRARRPHVVAKTDARGVAQLLRMHDGKPLAQGEFLIELTPKDGQWTLVTDAWFFAEGEAQRWERARYGEFRILPDGRALLVDLRGAQLERL